MLCCNETITIVRHATDRDSDRYTCEVIVGASWYGKRGDHQNASSGSGEAPHKEYAVRIPAALVPSELPQEGDIIVRGILPEYTGKKCLSRREWFRISIVGDNRRGRFLPHLVVKNT